MLSPSPRAAVATALASLGLLAACIPPSRRGNDPQQPPPPSPWQMPPPATTAAPPATPTAAATPPPAATTAPAATTPMRRPTLRLPRPIVVKPTQPAAGKGCGSLDVDGVEVSLDCFTKDYGRVTGAQRMPPPGPGAKVAVEYVDRRAMRLEGPTRHQRRVGSGAAFALASVMDQGLIRNGAGFLPVSAMHLWARSPKPLLGELVQASLGKGVASEAAVPYDEAKACLWASPEAAVICKPPKHENPGATDVDPAPFARLVNVLELDGTSGEALRDALTRDQDLLYALRVDPEAWKSMVKSPDAEPLLPDYAGSTAVHTVTLAGFALQDGQWFYLVKNSWGPSWGRDGYAWIQETTLKKNYVAAFAVQVSVVNGPTVGPAGPHLCPPGQLPDAVSKACAPACPNGSQQKGGVCK